MICWRCHSNSVNTGSLLPICSDVKTRNRRNVVGIDMIRDNVLDSIFNKSTYNPYCYIRFAKTEQAKYGDGNKEDEYTLPPMW